MLYDAKSKNPFPNGSEQKDNDLFPTFINLKNVVASTLFLFFFLRGIECPLLTQNKVPVSILSQHSRHQDSDHDTNNRLTCH